MSYSVEALFQELFPGLLGQHLSIDIIDRYNIDDDYSVEGGGSWPQDVELSWDHNFFTILGTPLPDTPGIVHARYDDLSNGVINIDEDASNYITIEAYVYDEYRNPDYDENVWGSRIYENYFYTVTKIFSIGASLFTIYSNRVNFQALTSEQRDAVISGADLYNALNGDDIVTLPDARTIEGRQWNPFAVFNADEGRDIVDGGRLDDRINGGSGDDRLDGGGGSNTAYFSGSGNSYTFYFLSPLGWRSSGPDGNDILSNFHHFTFVGSASLSTQEAFAQLLHRDTVRAAVRDIQSLMNRDRALNDLIADAREFIEAARETKTQIELLAFLNTSQLIVSRIIEKNGGPIAALVDSAGKKLAELLGNFIFHGGHEEYGKAVGEDAFELLKNFARSSSVQNLVAADELLSLGRDFSDVLSDWLNAVEALSDTVDQIEDWRENQTRIRNEIADIALELRDDYAFDHDLPKIRYDGESNASPDVIDGLRDYVPADPRMIGLADQVGDLLTSYLSTALRASETNLKLAGAASEGVGNQRDNRISGNDYQNNLSGEGGNDILLGGRGADRLVGGAGNDWLNGGQGVDRMGGGVGNDAYWVDHARDVVMEAPQGGVDLVRASVSHALTANVENLLLTGTEAINGTGNGLANVLIGNARASLLNGAAGNDRVSGGGGSDRLFGAAGNDILDGGQGIDRMAGGLGNDVYVVDHVRDVAIEGARAGTDLVRSSVSFVLGANLENLLLTGAAALAGTGNAAANVLIGNAGANRLSGGDGADRLSGGLGADALLGGAGADDFVFTSAAAARGDRIGDFVRGQDQIDLRAFDADVTRRGVQDFHYVGSGPLEDAGDLRFAGGLLTGDLNGDGRGDFAVGVTGIVALSRNDFLL